MKHLTPDMDSVTQKIIADRQALASKEVSLESFQKLCALEKRGIVRVGVNFFVARKMWQDETIPGKILPVFGGLVAIATPFTFWFLGWKLGLVNIAAFYAFHRLQLAMSGSWSREIVMSQPHVFHFLYCQGNIGIQVRSTGQRILVPTDWMIATDQLQKEAT